jgi:hypothetical protein
MECLDIIFIYEHTNNPQKVIRNTVYEYVSKSSRAEQGTKYMLTFVLGR